jgi:hypothetical protein
MLVIGQIPFCAEEVLCLPNCLIERKMLEAMDRVVMHKPFHRPELGDRLDGLLDLEVKRARGHF